MKRNYSLWMGIALFVFLFTFGCQSPSSVKDENPKKDEVKKEAKNQDVKTGEIKSEKPKPEKVMSDAEKMMLNYEKGNKKDEKLTKQQQQAFINHLLKTAKAKISRHEYNSAKDFIDQALQLDSNNLEANKLKDLVGSILGDRYSQVPALSRSYEEEVRVKVEQAKLEIRNHYKRGLKSLNEKDYDKAIREFEAALEIIKWAPYELGMNSLRKQAEIKIQEANKARESWLASQREAKMREAQKEAEKLEKEEQARKTKQIQILLTRATEYYVRKKFDKANVLIEEVLTLDPSNKTAKKLQEDIHDANHSYIAEKTLRKKIQEWKKMMEEMKETVVPYSKEIIYPDRDFWNNVVRKREKEGQLSKKQVSKQQESRAIRNIKTKLDTIKINFNFNETPFEEVIRYIQAMAGINIVVDPKVVRNFEIEGTKISLTLSNLKLQDALNILLKFHNLTYFFQDDVLYITSTDSELAKEKPIPVLHDIRDLTGQIKDFPGPKIQLLAAKQNQDTGGAIFTDEEPTTGPVLTGEKLTELIKSSIGPETWDKDAYSIAETTGQLLVVHNQKTQQEIREFLNDMRRFSGMMVAIESRFLEVTDDFIELLGVEWRGIGDDGLTTNDPDDASDNGNIVMPALTKDNEDFAGGAADNGGSSYSPAAGMFFQESNSDIRIRTEHVDSGLTGSRISPSGGFSMQLAFLDDLELAAVIQAVKKKSRGELLMAPRLTAFNTQRSNLTVVRQISYVRDFDVEVAQSAYIADPVIGVVQVGVVLDVRPTISNDRKYITLELRPTVASLLQMRQFTTDIGNSGREVTFDMPEISLQSVETTIRMPDEGTVIIGGLKTIRELDRKIDIPILGNIPIVSFFFSETGKLQEKSNLIILIKSKIIDLEEEEEKAVGAKR